MNVTLRVALRRRSDAEKLIEVAMKREHPPGSAISWERNGFHMGEVVQHGYGDSIKVRNRRTSKEYWIHAGTIAL